jgi:hypothetical protein
LKPCGACHGDCLQVYFVAPPVVAMKQDIKDFLTSKGVAWQEGSCRGGGGGRSGRGRGRELLLSL